MSNRNDIDRAGLSYATGAGAAKSSVASRLMSLTVAANATDLAAVTIHDATVTSLGTVHVFNAPAGESRHFSFEPEGVNFDTGISVSQSGSPTHILVTWVVQ